MEIMKLVLQFCMLYNGYTAQTPLSTIGLEKATDVRNCMSAAIDCHMKKRADFIYCVGESLREANNAAQLQKRD
jgi:hypothetical protein